MNYRYTDAGRAGSRRPRQKDDCTVRAYSLACGVLYDDAYDALKEAGRKSHRKFDFKTWANAQPGFRWIGFPAVKGQRRMTVDQFTAKYPSGVYILRFAKHVATVRDGVLLDTDPQTDRCVYGAWAVE